MGAKLLTLFWTLGTLLGGWFILVAVIPLLVSLITMLMGLALLVLMFTTAWWLLTGRDPDTK